MKLTILAENLQKKLGIVLHSISSRSQLQILSHVLLETKGESLSISATDLEIGIEITIPAEVEEQGATTIPAKLFFDLVQVLPAEKITLQTNGENLEIFGKKNHSLLQTVSKEEFPVLYEELGEKMISFPKEEVKNVFSRVVFSSSPEATRPALSGVLFKKEENGLSVVATDGYRLSLDIIEEKVAEGLSLVVPGKIIKEAIGISAGEKVELFLSSHNNQIAFSQPGTILIGRLIEAEFPNYKKIIPTDFSTKVNFDKEAMQKAVRACSIFAREAANIVKFSIKKDKMIISAKTPSLGENTVEIDCQTEGEENDIAFNAKYVLDFLANISEEQLIFEMSGPLNAGVFRIAENKNFLHLIMPIRTQE